ncbi:hypothetical protein BCR37DRAFT_407901, partial [Protomyces lactucae-debilis]
LQSDPGRISLGIAGGSWKRIKSSSCSLDCGCQILHNFENIKMPVDRDNIKISPNQTKQYWETAKRAKFNKPTCHPQDMIDIFLLSPARLDLGDGWQVSLLEGKVEAQNIPCDCIRWGQECYCKNFESAVDEHTCSWRPRTCTPGGPTPKQYHRSNRETCLAPPGTVCLDGKAAQTSGTSQSTHFSPAHNSQDQQFHRLAQGSSDYQSGSWMNEFGLPATDENLVECPTGLTTKNDADNLPNSPPMCQSNTGSAPMSFL